ncbi:hypothetical protein EST38_g13811 [Candolleomyces aberdarensis]|uniref:Uncharacterized protein n=1 Tax=Candolleomyces aberdarensis TaxID=2316362 RepID=A0A4Q2D1P2_9AGAR|nr:hypothetical protein EST38_g13811 [Candolleomyces aberdarensis]
MANNFNNAHDFQIDNYHYVNVNSSVDPLSTEINFGTSNHTNF